MTGLPCAVYTFVQVKADTFVKYDDMAFKLCEVTMSLTFYPPGNAYLDNKTAEYEQMTGRFFSSANAYTNLRNTTRAYFANKKNHFYANHSNPTFNFESEVMGLSVV